MVQESQAKATPHLAPRREITQELHVSKRTIDTHLQNLKNKLDLKNSFGLEKAAYKLKLIEE